MAACIAGTLRTARSNSRSDSTAAAIARELRLIESGDERVITGAQLEEMNDADLDKMVEMVNYWEREVEKDMDWKDIFEVGWRMREVVSKVKLTALTVPVGERKGEGAIYYPGYLVGGQWVFLPSDGNYEVLRKFFEINMTSLENRI